MAWYVALAEQNPSKGANERFIKSSDLFGLFWALRIFISSMVTLPWLGNVILNHSVFKTVG